MRASLYPFNYSNYIYKKKPSSIQEEESCVKLRKYGTVQSLIDPGNIECLPHASSIAKCWVRKQKYFQNVWLSTAVNF